MKNLVKKLLAAGFAAGAALSMAGCSGIQAHAYSVAEKTEQAVSMPEEYSITYEVQKPEEDFMTLVTKARDEQGSIYFSDGEIEKLFLNEKGNYRLYERDGDGEFTESPGKKIYTESFIDTATAAFTQCAEQSELQFAPGFEEGEKTTVAGRACHVFTNKMGVGGMNVTYVLQIDEESGICLGYNEVSETGIFTSKPSKTVFSCTEFATENVKLPVEAAE